MHSDFRSRYIRLIDRLPYTMEQKYVLRERYVDMVVRAEHNYTLTSILYVCLSNIVTISGVLITGFLSLDKMRVIGDQSYDLFWVVWALSIALTLANKWLHSFNIDKKYALNIGFLEKLYSEGWSFAVGIGRYAIEDHSARYLLFCARVEKMKIKTLKKLPEFYSDAESDFIAMCGIKCEEKNEINIAVDAAPTDVVPTDNTDPVQ